MQGGMIVKVITHRTIILLAVTALIACSGTDKKPTSCDVDSELRKLRGIQQLNATAARDQFIALPDSWKNNVMEWQRTTQQIVAKTSPQSCETLHEQAKILMGLLEGLEEPSQKIRRQIAAPRLPKEEELLQVRAKETSP